MYARTRPDMTPVRRLLTIVAGLAALLALGTPAATGAEFALSIYDPVFSSSDAASRTLALDRATEVHAEWVRIAVRWSSVAPSRRTDTFGAADPDDPAYRWSTIDAAVREASARGRRVLLTLNGAPSWAEGANRPPAVAAGSWKPDVTAFGAFALATARRFSGNFTPDGATAPLPPVRAFQAWNEPNLSLYLSPQWQEENGRLRTFAAKHYRAMLNAFARSVHAVRRENLVVTAGTAPFGDPRPGGERIRPVRFWQDVLSEPASLDVLAHHPYGVGGPLDTALSPQDVSVPDVHRLERLLADAAAAGKVRSQRKPRLWVTEIAWDSGPPDPDGVPISRHARWLEQAMYVLWRQGVNNVFWFRVVDQGPTPSYSATSQSGLYELSGASKPAAQAFTMPFVVDRPRGRIWGIAPRSGKVRIERQSGERWRLLATARAGNDRVFSAVVRLPKRAALRAVQGGSESLPWR
jgi:hypothetical protein